SVVPKPPGWWDVFFAGAQLLLIAAVANAMRSFALMRIAALDACVITCAAIALGAAFVGRGLEHHITTLTLVPLNRPILGIVTLISMPRSLGVATYALIRERRNVALIAVAASLAIAASIVARARDSLRTAEQSSEMLDSVLADSERTRDELHLANSRLQQAN